MFLLKVISITYAQGAVKKRKEMIKMTKRVKEAYATDKAERLINSLCKLCGRNRNNYIAVMNMLTAKYTQLNEDGKLR